MSNYQIGYGKPPKKTRWKKGQSGNTRGRPKKPAGPLSIDDAEILARLDNEPVHIGGKQMCRREAEVRIIFEMAFRGNRKAMRLQEQLLREASTALGGGVIHLPATYFLEEEH